MDSPEGRAGRVFVFGSANHDHVLSVDAFPTSGQTILAAGHVDGLGGKGANQAVAAASTGADVVFVGAVGDDARADALVDNLALRGIDVTFVARTEEPTGIAIVLVDDAGSNEIIVAPGANAALPIDVVDRALDAVEPMDIVVVQCEIPSARVDQAVRGGARRGATVILNLAPFTALSAATIAAADLLVVNESEAAALLGRADVGHDAAATIVATTGTSVVVTLGSRGSVHAAPGQAPARVAAAPVERIVDTTGAGDVYVGTLAAGLAASADVAAAMEAASVAAAASVTHAGAQAAPACHPVQT